MIRIDERREDPYINVVPLIDIVFFMIVFFLTATSFLKEERDQEVVLPANRNPSSLSREAAQKVIVNVLRDGAIRVAGRRTSEGELASSLRERVERSGGKTFQVLVRADRRTAYGNVAAALSAIERAGVQRPFVVTRWLEIED